MSWLRRSAVRSPGAAPQSPSVSSCMSRSAAKPFISRRNVASDPFSRRARRAILSSVIAVVLGFRLCLDNSTLPKITAVATSGPASARLSAVAPAGPSAASYTTTRGTTQCHSPQVHPRRARLLLQHHHDLARDDLCRLATSSSGGQLHHPLRCRNCDCYCMETHINPGVVSLMCWIRIKRSVAK